MRRQYEVFGDERFERLAGLSNSHLYRMRQSTTYRRRRNPTTKTQATQVNIGERRKPHPQGRPGFLRVDSVHQGDLDGRKGVYEVNLVDEVTQYEFVAAVEGISERFLVPALEALIEAFPLEIKGFHVDNGSEYINYRVARLLRKLMHVNEARVRAASMVAALRCGADAPASPQDAIFEVIAEIVFQRYAQVWKPRTLDVNRTDLRRQILPAFAARQIAEITRQDVQRWFASLRATPAAADRSMPVLSVILKEAELLGYRPEGSNPCRGLRRYRRKGRERFLSDEEIGRVATRLSAHEAEWPLEVAAVRFLMLTGCRKGEVVTLRWSDYRAGHLFSATAKPGRGRCGCPAQRVTFVRTSPAPAPGSSRCEEPASRRAGIGSTSSGGGFAPKLTCPMYACMTFATATPPSPFGRA